MGIEAFKIDVSQSTIDDLRVRLGRARWTDEVEGAGWDYGTNLEYLRELCAYWQNDFDWRRQEEKLNSFHHFRTAVDGFELHYIHEKGRGANSIPLLLTHGFPDSFYRFYKIIPLLTENIDGVSFDVVVPSIPGYGFSARPHEKGFGKKRIAGLFHRLMTENLGYRKFAAHGGDWGSGITEQIAFDHPDSLTGIHLTDIPYQHLFMIPPEDLSEVEKKYLEAGKKWQQTDGGYAAIQSTQPQTLGAGLNDSPAGLAAWIIDLFRKWSDCDGDLENSFTKDELLTNITIYWATQTIHSASRLYYETMREVAAGGSEHTDVPAGVALFPKDLIPAPREFGERVLNIQRWTEMPRGGHFAALEEPELLAEDIRAFFRDLQR